MPAPLGGSDEEWIPTLALTRRPEPIDNVKEAFFAVFAGVDGYFDKTYTCIYVFTHGRKRISLTLKAMYGGGFGRNVFTSANQRVARLKNF